MYEMKTAAETIRLLKSDREKGLDSREALTRSTEHGPNRLKEQEKKSIWQMILGQLNDPLILILIVAMAISILLGEAGDAVIIITVVILNAAIGVIQEGKAGKAVEALKQISAPQAVVIRDGKTMKISAEKLVIGDIVLLEAGNMVPADLRLIETQGIQIEESTLTGESAPVDKNADFVEMVQGDNIHENMAYMSTFVTKGRGKGIVTAIGMDTEIGRIADLLHGTGEKMTPLQIKLGELGKVLSILAISICTLLFVIAVLQKRNVGEMLLTSVSLTVAAVPEGLPAIVTIVLALSVSRMVRAKTIVRKLSSVETLGSVEVVCSDKTGTLTQNKMTVMECYIDGKIIERDKFKQFFTDELWKDNVARKSQNNAGERRGTAEEIRSGKMHFMLGCILCNDAVVSKDGDFGDPTEMALIHMARECTVPIEELRGKYYRKDEKAFDSERKMMTTCHLSIDNTERHRNSSREGDGSNENNKKHMLAYSKGAAERVLEGCSFLYRNGHKTAMSENDRRSLYRVLEQMMDEGRRVLAIAMNPDGGMQETDMVFLGFVCMQDPVRPEAVEAVEEFKKAGVETVMITGDHCNTAFSIAKELKIAKSPDECISGRELDTIEEHVLLKRLPKLKVFARVTPEHKVKIVEGYKKLGKTVAMTGDGVNDAPSLQSADIGIAMGMNGTDVARNAADFVLMDDNFATIQLAIKEGRGIYENIRKSVLFLLSSNLGEIMTMLVTIIAGFPSPLKASFILWINLITDSLPALALGVDDNETEILMKEAPRRKGESLFAKGGLMCVICYGLVIGGVSLAAFLKVPYDRLIAEQLPISLHNIVESYRISAVLSKAQTHAFMVLGMSQLFHAIGMRDVNKSIFKMDHKKNPYMLLAVGLGLLLQFVVTEVEPLITLFGTVRLDMVEWAQLLALSLTPVIVHELLVAVYKGHNTANEKIKSGEEQVEAI
ncbi:MAG: cation-translocating P-type ATPase [Lachnospiraceae bacterium]|nr:cation-translocating P-type ATPase [Lachnospiraceae bacterium]